MNYSRVIENVISQFMKLPGIGRKSAERMAFWLLDHPAEEALALMQSVKELKESIRLCRECNNLTERELCAVCADPGRDRGLLCVVEDTRHLLAIERTGMFKGLYYVLLGIIAPMEGRGPGDLKIAPLLERVRREQFREVVIATDPDTEGEMTAIHLMNEIRPLGVKVTRIGLGIPVGSSVEYADLSTLTMSLNARREMTI